MLLTLKIVLGVIGALMVFLGLNWMFNPGKMMAQHDIQSTSPTGRNYLRGDIGGLLLAGALFIFLFLYQGSDPWLYPGILLISAVILGRVTSLVVDGKSKLGIQAILVEVVIIGLLLGIDRLS